jgi:hypothetical protein
MENSAYKSIAMKEIPLIFGTFSWTITFRYSAINAGE